ncbi:AraC-like ligand-binding domain-containing protein [Kitasatospora sp. NPDC054939]
MDVITLHSRDVPAEHRFEWWCDLISRDVAPTRISTDHVTDFHAAAGAVDLGPVQLSALSFPPLRSTRTPALIRRSDPEVYELALIMGSEMWISQARNETRIRAGDLVLWETSHPFDGRGLSGNDQSRAIILHLPRATLPLPATRVDRLLAQAMPARSGMGAILARYLRSVLREAPTLDRADAERLGRTAWDLAAAFLAHRLGTQERLPVESRRQALLARIDTFIDHHLSDSGLTPPTVAARHHISVRSLHLLFQQRGEGVAARIRRRRLEHCRADLADPLQRTLPIRAVAARYGFASAADFSRAFRAAYGMPPSEYRRAALDAAAARGDNRTCAVR